MLTPAMTASRGSTPWRMSSMALSVARSPLPDETARKTPPGRAPGREALGGGRGGAASRPDDRRRAEGRPRP